jgi:hypothetical protein
MLIPYLVGGERVGLDDDESFQLRLGIQLPLAPSSRHQHALHLSRVLRQALEPKCPRWGHYSASADSLAQRQLLADGNGPRR